MQWLDYVVLVGYFATMIGIGVYTSRKIKNKEDYFMGGRGFGKLLQTFAAFGAGTGSSDPVATGRTTFTSGMSGMWSVMYWLFVTPFYWITGVWYRRMRHLTLGDWFVERYQSRHIGLGYAIFGIGFFIVYGSMMFSAIGKVAAPLVQADTVAIPGVGVVGIEYVLVPIIGLVVLGYGIAGGLEAAYYTDLIQGLCIILLSIILIPFGLNMLVQEFGDPSTQSMFAGFKIMHQQLPPEYFDVVGSTSGSEFPWYRILAVVIINLVGIVVQPHFIATGGGSAKTETNARVGLVVGNFLKRFCTIGWVLTALIALALYADNAELISDPDKTWGVASRELLPVGLTGLMLACLLAALMSSADAYMVVGSALVVRNVYVPYFNPNASEREYVFLGRLTGGIIILGAVVVSLFMMNVFAQLQLTWVFGVLFAAPFWVGMYWRGATRAGAWASVAFCALMFFAIPFLAPRVYPALRTSEAFLVTNEVVVTTTLRKAAPSDVKKRASEIATWEQKLAVAEKLEDAAKRETAIADLGAKPAPLAVGDTVEMVEQSGGQSVFWGDGVTPVDKGVKRVPHGETRRLDENTTQLLLVYPEGTKLEGQGNFKLDFLMYQLIGVDLQHLSNAMLSTLELPPKIVTPFLVMILVSLFTPKCEKEGLDRYYSKMKTPVIPDPEKDRLELENAYKRIDELEKMKIFPGSSLEFQKPRVGDIVGFVVCVLVCFAIIGMAVLVASLGG
ncbi:MAG: sodium:solute symporter family protein [Pirellulaceae bacterium]